MNDMNQLLFARPSLIEGMARAVDLGGTLVEYNCSTLGEIADQVAIESDWITVRQDSGNVMNIMQKKLSLWQVPESDR
jgi:hypothetical protein